jgi:cytochrome c556
MKKLAVVAVIALVLGGMVGAMLQQRAMRQRQHALAVMWLAQYHLQSLQAAVARRDCAVVTQSAAALHGLASELALALPLADAQDATFHGYIEQLRSAAAPGVITTPATASPTSYCADAAAMLKRVRAACADCHRDYR